VYNISLKNGKTYDCAETDTIFQGAKYSGILLEHSCLAARCSSCKVQVVEGQTINIQDENVLTAQEKEQGYVLSCNVKPRSDIKLNNVDLGEYMLSPSRTLPAKIHSMELLTPSVLKVMLRIPPAQNFSFLAGQYVNLIKGSTKRSYSIANNSVEDGQVEFLIKNYPGGAMSNYFFNEAKVNDLLRMEGPLGSFFLRNSKTHKLVFLATGTGIAPVKSILEQIAAQQTRVQDKHIYVLWGGRYLEDLFWKPTFERANFHFIPVLSRENVGWEGAKGYVQDMLLNLINDFSDTEVYACGSNQMIEAAREFLYSKGLPKDQFYSDAFVQTN
jgi:CDP-4-dehydro-6-deoxyglucose reductase